MRILITRLSPCSACCIRVESACRGYLLTQVVGGIAADRLGGKLVLGMGVVWWSLATVLTPLAAQVSLPVLLGMRALMGVGEGVAMPAMNNMLSRWIPSGERSRSLALVYSGMYVGSMLGLGLSPGIISSQGWPSVFYIFGSMGVFWWLFWTFRASSTPGECQDIEESELKYISANTAVSQVCSFATCHRFM
jgi:MFS transporter, ACS family, solute carrier family 17 (sodium-dependent inorganic phosphate cotransporter), other